MMSRNPSIAVFLAFFLYLTLGPGTVEARRRPYLEEEKPHTTWLFWRRPAQSSPDLQLQHALRFEQQGKYRAAAAQYQRLVIFWPDAAEAPQAQLQYATLQHRRGKLEKAFEGYQKLLERYPNHAPYEEILERQYGIAQDLMVRRHGTLGVFRGFARPKDALDPLKTIAQNGPRWERAAEAQFLVGSIHEEDGDYELAIVEYMNTMVRHADSPYAEQAALARCRCLMNLADGNRYDMDQWQEAWYALNLFRATYPDSPHTPLIQDYMQRAHDHMARAAFDVAVFYDENTPNQTAALVAYRSFAEQFPASQWTPQARERIEALSRKVEPAHAE